MVNSEFGTLIVGLAPWGIDTLPVPGVWAMLVTQQTNAKKRQNKAAMC
jgi:hypothetical protein